MERGWRGGMWRKVVAVLDSVKDWLEETRGFVSTWPEGTETWRGTWLRSNGPWV